MVSHPGMASKTSGKEMSLGKFVELSAQVTRQLPRDMSDKLSQYFIDHPLFLGAVLEELRDVIPLPIEHKYFRLPGASHAFDLRTCPIADWEGQDRPKADAFGALSQNRRSDVTDIEYGYLYWVAMGPQPRTIDVLRHIRAGRRTNAAAIDLLYYFGIVSSCCQHWGLNGATVLHPLTVKGQRFTLSYTNSDGKQTWSLLPYDVDKLWPYNHGFFVFDGRKEGKS